MLRDGEVSLAVVCLYATGLSSFTSCSYFMREKQLPTPLRSQLSCCTCAWIYIVASEQQKHFFVLYATQLASLIAHLNCRLGSVCAYS